MFTYAYAYVRSVESRQTHVAGGGVGTCAPQILRLNMQNGWPSIEFKVIGYPQCNASIEHSTYSLKCIMYVMHVRHMSTVLARRNYVHPPFMAMGLTQTDLLYSIGPICTGRIQTAPYCDAGLKVLI